MDLIASSTSWRQMVFDRGIDGIDTSVTNGSQLMIKGIASIILSGIFLIVAPIRLLQLRKGVGKNANGRNARILKLSLITCYGILKLLLLVWACLGVWILPVPALALSFADVFFLGALSYVEHSKSRKPSTILGLYLLFSIVIDCIPTGTELSYTNSYKHVIAPVYMGSVAFKAAIFFLELREKTPYGTVENEGSSPEESIGLFNRIFYFWMNDLLVRGYRKDLGERDMFPLDRELSSDSLRLKFQTAWEKEKWAREKRGLLIATIKTLKWPFLIPVVPRLLEIVFSFGQPLLIKRILLFLQAPETENSKQEGYRLIAAWGFIFLANTLAGGTFWYRLRRFNRMVRSCLISAIYTKVTELPISKREKSAAVTLMSTDVQRIMLGLSRVHELWASAIELIVASVLLQRELGVACLVPFGVTALSIGASALINSKIVPRQKAWVTQTQVRINEISSMLPAMKGIKLLGLSSKMLRLIESSRIKEVTLSGRYRALQCLAIVNAFAPLFLTPALVFTAYIAGVGGGLDPSTVFTVLSLLNLLLGPLSGLFQWMPIVVGLFGYFTRIEEFLREESRQDFRVLDANGSSTSSRPNGGSAKSNGQINNSSSHTQGFVDEIDEGTPDAILVRAGSFGWISEHEILHSIDLAIKRNHMTMIIGPVASGKSTLCAALLGETPISRGVVQLHVNSSDIAFCDQTPFLQNASLKHNIIGASDLEGTWYDKVLDATALHEDLSALPKGDESVIGSDGISLSGGQKQRVAIARAVYARKKTAIFDDVLSGLDTRTQRDVFNKVFGPQGLLRLNGTTVVLATHATRFLSSADHIVALGREGTIVEQGSFEHLKGAQGYLHSLDVEDYEADQSIPDSHTRDDLPQKGNATATSDAISPSHSGDKGMYKFYLSSTGLFNCFLGFMLAISLTFTGAAPLLVLKKWTDPDTPHDGASNAFYLGIFALLRFCALASVCSLAYIVFVTMITRSGLKLHDVLLTVTMGAPMTFFSETDKGITTNRFTQDIQMIDGELPGGYINVATSVFTGLGQVILIVVASPPLFLTLPFVAIIFRVVQKLYLKTTKQLRVLDLESKSPLTTHFQETLTGLPTLRSFGRLASSQSACDLLIDSSNRPGYLLSLLEQWLTMTLNLMGDTVALILVAVAIVQRADSGFTGVALINVTSLTMMMQNLMSSWTSMENAMGAVSRIQSYQIDTPCENFPSEKETPPPAWPSQGRIDVSNTSVSYKPDGKEMVLKDLSLNVRAGEKIGICGRTGSGKTSFMLSLFRMVEIRKGSIRIDGVDITTLPREDVRRQLNAVPQDPFFLEGTIRSNIDPYETASDNEVTEALKKVQLWGEIEKQGGLETTMDMNKLSHGQRQLFCLARAILRPGKIVVLDEATSSVDAKTEELMLRIVKDDLKDRTVIAIAHNLNTILDFDRIALLREGRLVEFDSPRELLGRKSAFKELYDSFSKKNKEQKAEEAHEIVEGATDPTGMD